MARTCPWNPVAPEARLPTRPRTGEGRRSVGICANEVRIRRLVGAILLEQNDEYAVQRALYMTRKAITEMREPPAMNLSAVAP